MAIIKSTSSLSAPPKKVNIGKFFASSQKKVQTAKVKQSSDALRNELVAIRDNVIKIDNLVRSNLIFQRKVSSDNRKNKEGEERSKREKKLESYKSKLPGVEFPVLPRFDFIESIKRFIFFTFLGAAFPKLIELVPKLVNFAKIISPAVNFFADVAKGLLNGLVTFIDWGYQIQDNTQKIAKQIGGENAEKKFNEFIKSLNTFIDLSILAGLTALDVGLDAEKFRREQLKKGQQKPPRGRVGVTEGKGGAKNLGRRAEVTTGKGGARNLGKRAAVTVSGESKGVLKNLRGPFAKLKGPLSKFAGAAVPGLGAAVGAADAAARFAAGDKVGGTLASVSAALDALTAGTAILAATGIGAAVPAAFATVSMGIDVVLLIRDIVKVFFPQIPMFAGGGRIKLMAQGGRVGSPGRSIKVSRKKLPIGKPQDTRPGKDVGGKQQILKLYPDGSPENIRQTTTASPWWARLFGGGNNQTTASQPIGGKRPSPLKAIENTSKSLKKIPIPFISALMGAGSDVNLGQKPDKNLGDIVGGSIGKLTQDIIDNNMKLSFSDIVRFISGYANGGDVRSGNIIKENDIGYQVGSMVSKVISTAISSRVDEAINGILREITGQGKPAEEQAPGGGIDGSGGPDVFHGMGPERMWNFFKNKGLSDYAVAGILGNADTESDFIPTIKSPDGRFIGLFQWDKNIRWPALANWATQKGLDPWAFDTQLMYAWHELKTSENQTMSPLRAATSASAAAEVWREKFERGPGKPQERMSDAEKWYKKFKGKVYIPIPPVGGGGLPLTGDNGRMKPSQLMRVGTLSSSPTGGPYWYGNGAYLRKSDAGPAFLRAKAAAEKEGVKFIINSAYRTLEHQRALQGRYAVVAAVGRSPHGEGIALDIQTNTRGWTWLKNNGPSYGWRWMAIKNDEVHFEYVGRGISPNQPPTPSPPDQPTPPRTSQPNQSRVNLGIQNSMRTRNFGRVSGVGSKGYIIIPGHAAGGGAPGEKELVKKLARNAYNNIKAKNPNVKVMLLDVDSMFDDTESGYKKYLSWIEKKEKDGYEIIEIHMDTKRGTGRGAIVPHRELNPVEAYFARTYGAYDRRHRSPTDNRNHPDPTKRPLGGPSRGVGYIELGNMTDELNNADKKKLDKLTKPLEESFLQSSSSRTSQSLAFTPSYQEGSSSLVAIQLVNRTTIVSETA